MDTDNKNNSCQWQVKFRVKPSLRESENVDVNNEIYKFKFDKEGDDKGKYITFNYETNEFYLDLRNNYEYAEEKAGRYELSLRNLMLERMIYKRTFDFFEIKRVSGSRYNSIS